MTLTERINEDIKSAMRAKEQTRLAALRAIKSGLLLLATGKEGSSKDAEIKMLLKQVKQRKEAAEIYQSQNRTEQAEAELAEAAVIEEYLPKQMTAEELKSELSVIISETGASGPADMGKVMGVASKKLAGKAEGKLIAQVVRELLNS